MAVNGCYCLLMAVNEPEIADELRFEASMTLHIRRHVRLSWPRTATDQCIWATTSITPRSSHPCWSTLNS